jgi:hypothetical protein
MKNYKNIVMKTANVRQMSIAEFFGIKDEPDQLVSHAAALDPRTIPQGAIIFDFDAKHREKLLDVIVRGTKRFSIHRERSMQELTQALRNALQNLETEKGTPMKDAKFYIKRSNTFQDVTPRMREVVLHSDGLGSF